MNTPTATQTMKLNVRQAAWYVERDGARRVRVDADGTEHFEGAAAGGTYRFHVGPADMAAFDRERDAAYRALADKRRNAR